MVDLFHDLAQPFTNSICDITFIDCDYLRWSRSKAKECKLYVPLESNQLIGLITHFKEKIFPPFDCIFNDYNFT